VNKKSKSRKNREKNESLLIFCAIEESEPTTILFDIKIYKIRKVQEDQEFTDTRFNFEFKAKQI
jgi:hypothetical protein